MGARDASIDAYHEVVNEGGQLAEFEHWIKEHGPCTRAMVGHALGYGANVYSARVNKLVKDGVVVELPVKAKCHITGVTVGWVVHRKRVTLAQLKLDGCPDCARAGGTFTMTKICCAARYVVDNCPDMALGVTATAHRYGHDEEQLKLVINAVMIERRKRLMAKKAGPAANEVPQ